MTAWLLSNLSTLLFGLGGVIVALFAAWAKGRTSGAKAEREKQAEAETKARTLRMRSITISARYPPSRPAMPSSAGGRNESPHPRYPDMAPTVDAGRGRRMHDNARLVLLYFRTDPAF